MARFERGDIVKIKGCTAGHCVVESYLEPDNGPPVVQIWYDKIIVQFMGKDLDKVDLVCTLGLFLVRTRLKVMPLHTATFLFRIPRKTHASYASGFSF